MKVIAINGSQHKNGNTYEGIKLITNILESEGIETEIVQVGSQQIKGCIGCGACFRDENHQCFMKDDILNETALKMREADGIILGSPVYYSGISGTMKCFLDRAFYTSSRYFKYKVGASVAAVRRAGGVDTFHQLNNYFNLANMMIAPSHYWNVIYGARAGEALQDLEGAQVMENVGRNMAWLLKTVELGKKEIPVPEDEKRVFMNFIR